MTAYDRLRSIARMVTTRGTSKSNDRHMHLRNIPCFSGSSPAISGSIKSGTLLVQCHSQSPQDQAAVARGCVSLAPMMMSHSMMASSPNITGKTQLETLCSNCGHNMPVTLVAR